MRYSMLYAVTILFVSTSSAMAVITATLKAGPTNALGTNEGAGPLYTIPAAGARFDISVSLDRLVSDPSVWGLGMQFVSNGNGAATINQAIGFGRPSGTSTRFTTDWYDGDCSTPPTSALTATSGGFYGCGYVPNGFLWGPGAVDPFHTLMGFINVTVGATTGERTFTITPVYIEGTDQDFESVFGQGLAVAIHQLPEPASALLLLGALPSFRRRRGGG